MSDDPNPSNKPAFGEDRSTVPSDEPGDQWWGGGSSISGQNQPADRPTTGTAGQAWVNQPPGSSANQPVAGQPIGGQPSGSQAAGFATAGAPPGPPPGQPPTTPPGMPPGSPPVGPAAGASGSPGGPTGPTAPSNRTLLIVGGAVVALVVLLAGGVFAFKTLTAPEELTVRKYAKEYCKATKDATDEVSDAMEDFFDESEDLRDDDYEFTRVSDREADEFRDLASRYLDTQATLVNEVKAFSGSHRLKGRDGESLHEDIVEWADDSLEEIDDAKSDLDDVDMDDSDDAAQDIADAVLLDNQIIDESDEAIEIGQKTFEEDEDCGFPSAYEGGE